jgi:hypothetical protein
MIVEAVKKHGPSATEGLEKLGLADAKGDLRLLQDPNDLDLINNSGKY